MPDHGTASTGPTSANRRRPRVFVGLKMAPEIAAELAGIAQDLERDDVRRVAPDDIHLTLVPPWDEATPSEAIEKLRLVAVRFGAFPLEFQHVRYGPQLRWPRLLWAECLAAEELVALRAALLDVFGQQEEQPFRPHVTLARTRGNGRVIARKHPIDRELSLTQRIETVELFQSPPPGKSGYRILASCRLGETSKSAESR